MQTHWSEVVKNLMTAVAIIIGGVWTIYRFGLFREGRPKLQLDIELLLIGIHQDKYIVELCSIIENKGLVRQPIKQFKFDLRALFPNTPINLNNNWINNQVEFSETFILDKEWVPQEPDVKWYDAFIDGGVTQKYRYVTSIPKEVSCLLFYTRFSTKSLGEKKDVTKIPGEGLNELKRGDFYHVQKVFSIEKLIEDGSAKGKRE